MNSNGKYFTKLERGSCGLEYFEINPNQEYLYDKKSFQPWHSFSRKLFKRKYVNVLEVGCGNGALIETIDAQYRAGLELDAKAASLIDKKLVDVNIIRLEDYSNISINKEKFDVIFAFEVIEHFANPVDFIMSCKKLMKKGSILVGSTPNSTRWWVKLFKREEFDSPPNHFVMFDRIQLERLFSDHGFKIEYLNAAFRYQSWRHVSYRVLSLFGKKFLSNKMALYFGLMISIIFTPIFYLLNFLPDKYLHHGFVVIKE